VLRARVSSGARKMSTPATTPAGEQPAILVEALNFTYGAAAGEWNRDLSMAACGRAWLARRGGRRAGPSAPVRPAARTRHFR